MAIADNEENGSLSPKTDINSKLYTLNITAREASCTALKLCLILRL